jgi:hypothetical protein
VFRSSIIVLVTLLISCPGTVAVSQQTSSTDETLLLLRRDNLSDLDLQHIGQFLDAAQAIFAERSGLDDKAAWAGAKQAAPYLINSSMYLEGTVGSSRVYFVHSLDLIMVLSEERALLIPPDAVGSILGIEDAPAEGGQLLFLTMGRAQLMQAVMKQAAANDRFLRNLDRLSEDPDVLEAVAFRLFTAAVGMHAYTTSKCAPKVREYLGENAASIQQTYSVTEDMAQSLLPTMPGRDARGAYVISSDSTFGRFHLMVRFDESAAECGIEDDLPPGSSLAVM